MVRELAPLVRPWFLLGKAESLFQMCPQTVGCEH